MVLVTLEIGLGHREVHGHVQEVSIDLEVALDWEVLDDVRKLFELASPTIHVTNRKIDEANIADRSV